MMRSRIAIALIVFTGLVQAQVTQSSELLATLDGAWKGEGWAKRKTFTAMEKVQCRIENTYFNSSLKLVVKGRCAVPGRKFDLTGSITRNIRSGAISGRWSNPFGAGGASVTGAESGSRITLSFTAPHPDTGNKAAHLMLWDIANGKFTLTTRLGDDGIALSELHFSR